MHIFPISPPSPLGARFTTVAVCTYRLTVIVLSYRYGSFFIHEITTTPIYYYVQQAYYNVFVLKYTQRKERERDRQNHQNCLVLDSVRIFVTITRAASCEDFLVSR